MLNKPQLLRRLLALCGLLLLCSGVALSQLFQLQILSGEKYVRRSAEFRHHHVYGFRSPR